MVRRTPEWFLTGSRLLFVPQPQQYIHWVSRVFGLRQMFLAALEYVPWTLDTIRLLMAGSYVALGFRVKTSNLLISTVCRVSPTTPSLLLFYSTASSLFLWVSFSSFTHHFQNLHFIFFYFQILKFGTWNLILALVFYSVVRIPFAEILFFHFYLWQTALSISILFSYFFMVVTTTIHSTNSSSTSPAMTPSLNPPVSQADLDGQTTQMNLHFDAIMLLLEDPTKLKDDLLTIKEEATNLCTTTDTLVHTLMIRTSLLITYHLASLIFFKTTQLFFLMLFVPLFNMN